MILRAFTDGASRGNPGESGIGILVKDEAGKTLFSMHGYIGVTTNNIAEYTALLALLKKMRTHQCTRLRVHSDSELMVRQVNGEYKVRDGQLKKLYQRAMRVIGKLPFEFELQYIPREENREADRLANMGIDTRARVRV
jgi:ribonuclease HI